MARVALVIVVKVSGGGQSSSMRVVCPTFIAAFVFSWATKHKPGSMVGTAQYGGGTSGVHGTSEAKTVATRPFQEDPLHVCYCLSDVKKTASMLASRILPGRGQNPGNRSQPEIN